MNKEIKKQWVADLRDGTRLQGQDCLRNEVGQQCCLDVLMEQAVRAGVVPFPVYNSGEQCWGYLRPLRYEDGEIIEGSEEVREYSCLTDDVVKWAELDSVDPCVTLKIGTSTEPRTLSFCNDGLKLNFDQIADLIEEQL